MGTSVSPCSEGAGLGNNFLSHIQAVDGIFHVVRAFDSEDVGTAHHTDMTKCVKLLRAEQSKAKHGPITGSD